MRVHTCTTLALCHTQQRALKDYHIADSLWTLSLRNTTEEYVFCKSWIFCKLILPVDPHTSHLHNRTPCNPHTPSHQTPSACINVSTLSGDKKAQESSRTRCFVPLLPESLAPSFTPTYRWIHQKCFVSRTFWLGVDENVCLLQTNNTSQLLAVTTLGQLLLFLILFRGWVVACHTVHLKINEWLNQSINRERWVCWWVHYPHPINITLCETPFCVVLRQIEKCDLWWRGDTHWLRSSVSLPGNSAPSQPTSIWTPCAGCIQRDKCAVFGSLTTNFTRLLYWSIGGLNRLQLSGMGSGRYLALMDVVHHVSL